MSIGMRIAKLRTERHWTVTQLAQMIGTNTKSIKDWESDLSSPTIANVLNVSADMLLADVIEVGYNVKSSEMTEEIAALTPPERDRIYSVVNAMINFEKKK